MTFSISFFLMQLHQLGLMEPKMIGMKMAFVERKVEVYYCQLEKP
jgi:hypothetical protein